MAKDEAKKSKEKASKKLDISAMAVIDNIVFSKTDRWAYYRLSNKVFDFLSNDGRVSMAQQISNALNNLMSDRNDPLECHLIVTSTPVDVDAWESQVKEVSKIWNTSPGFNDYVQAQIQFLKNEEYLKRVAYLGINIGKRRALDLSNTNFLEVGVKGAVDTLKKWWKTVLAIPSAEIDVDEEKEARQKEINFFRILFNGNLQATRCSAEDLLLLIKRQFYPAMPAPYLDIDHHNRLGPGDLDLELYSAIEKKYRWLAINQQLGEHSVTGYRACLSFTKFPKTIDFPYEGFPFLYLPAKLSLPFTTYARFVLRPSDAMKKELERKKNESKDELKSMAVGQDALDSAVNPNSDVAGSLGDIQTMSDMIASDKSPWVEGSYRIVVETPDEEKLRKYCSIVRQQYSDLDINVNWTAGNQVDLFLEQMPGDHLRLKSFNQTTNLAMLSTSGFNFSSDIGDPIYGSDGDMYI
jgi:hypothetical protein